MLYAYDSVALNNNNPPPVPQQDIINNTRTIIGTMISGAAVKDISMVQVDQESSYETAMRLQLSIFTAIHFDTIEL